ncbi:MAG: MFS transporter [Candidatus Binatia bacterium]|nr:MFS transporter [Candidatus Binatia bacterium]
MDPNPVSPAEQADSTPSLAPDRATDTTLDAGIRPAGPAVPPLTMATKLWYGIGQAAEGIKDHAFTAFLLFYYTQTLGLSGTLAGFALIIALVFDAVTDPLTGVLSDRLDSKWGRRHPFMYAAALPMAVTFYLVFAPPAGLSDGALFAWLTVFTVLTRASMTLYHVPHMSLGAELSTDYDERTQIVQLRSIGGSLGIAACTAVPALYYFRPTPDFPNGQLNPAVYPPFAFVFGILICVAIFVSALGTHNRVPYLPKPDGSASERNALSGIVHDMGELLELESFRALFFGTTTIFIALGLSAALGLYAATYFWKITMTEMLIGGACTALGGIVGFIVWPVVANRIDKKPTFVLGATIFIIFAAIPYLLKTAGLYPAEGSAGYLPVYYVNQFLWTFGIIAAAITGGSMMADVTDEDECRNRRRREGVFFGASSFSAKCASGIGIMLAGMVVDYVGLVTDMAPEDVTPAMQANLGSVVGLTLLVLVSIGTVFFSRYKITREIHAGFRETLDARANED